MASTEIRLQKTNIKPVTSAEFTNICLDGENKPIKKKVPRKILHFSDGILEEYSTDEEDEKAPAPSIDPKLLPWLPWFWHYFVLSAVNTLGAADFCGEKLAWFFGITSPKYQHAIDEYYRLKEEEEEDKKHMEGKCEDTGGIQLSSINVEGDDNSKTPLSSPLKVGLNKEEYEKY